MRNLIEVIHQMQKQIPLSEERFHAALKSQEESILYSAPELMQLRWHETSYIINDFIHCPPDQLNEWQKKVVDIWMDKVK
jgi:hypothetical protein